MASLAWVGLPLGLTPPHGRAGHSVPEPRQLGEGPIFVAAPKSAVKPRKKEQNKDLRGISQVGWAISDQDDDDNPIVFSASNNNKSNNSNNGDNLPLMLSQWYPYRDTGCTSPLDRIRPPQSMKLLDTFHEGDDNDTSHEGSTATLSPDPYMYRSFAETHLEKTGLEKFTGDSMLSVSFNPSDTPLAPSSELSGSFISAFSRSLNTSFNVPCLHLPTSPTKDTNFIFPTVARNPNKALVTIDAVSSRILIANKVACELFCYGIDQLVGMKIQNLFSEPYRARQRALVEQNIDTHGETVLVSGKVMDAVSSFGVEFPVSVWMKKFTMANDPRVVVVIEPVQRTSTSFTIDNEGHIFSCDVSFAKLFGSENPSDLIGQRINDLVPSIVLPATHFDESQPPSKQMLTGRTRDGSVFPLTVRFIASAVVEFNESEVSPTDQEHPPNRSELNGSPTLTASKEDMRTMGATSKEDRSKENAISTVPGEHCKKERDEEKCKHTVDKMAGGKDMMSNGEMILDEVGKKPEQSTIEREGLLSPTMSQPAEIRDHNIDFFVNGKVIVYSSLSGMLSLLPDGTIHGCNHHFSLMLFGYSQQELIKKNITSLIPDFYNHIGYVDYSGMPFPPLSEAEFSEEEEDQVETEEDQVKTEEDEASVLFQTVSEKSMSFSVDMLKCVTDENEVGEVLLVSGSETVEDELELTVGDDEEENALETKGKEPIVLCVEEKKGQNEESVQDQQDGGAMTETIVHFLPSGVSEGDVVVDSEPTGSSTNSPSLPEHIPDNVSADSTKPLTTTADKLQTASTPLKEETPIRIQSKPPSRPVSRLGSTASHMSVCDGTFTGQACHKDGSLLPIIFQLKQIMLSDGHHVLCMWIARDMDHFNDQPHLSVTPLDQSLSPDRMCHGLQDPREEAIATDGEYSRFYDTLGSIGRGAFGFVKMARHKEITDLLVVVKFIRKSSVITGHWVQHEKMGLVPREISLLAGLAHENIVQLLEAYENEQYFQLVMEKHGDGMDLFSFIECNPRLDEALISYMFRQIVSALDYLHSINILHRDVKDENIILDHHFHIKLIDFGSAVYMEEGKKFNTFCGTIEYCSPEVLLGNSYSGPELEMWSLGVTLYTLVFGENPFFDVEDIISGRLQPPFLTSPGLMKVVLWLLHPDPQSRATLSDLQKDKWTNQVMDITKYSFEAVITGNSSSADLRVAADDSGNPLVKDKPMSARLNSTFS